MNASTSDIQEFLSDLDSQHVLVVGDVMLDRYLWGSVDRVSPEAPVPVVQLQRQTERAGGAANVAMNLAGLGTETTLIGGIGKDASGTRLKALLRDAEVRTDALIHVADRPTTTKTRVVGGRQQMLRLDEERVERIGEQLADRVLVAARDVLDTVDVVVFSDYDKGMLPADLCSRLISETTDRGIPVVVDPKGIDYEKYAGATVIAPNDRELAMATGTSGEEIESLLEAGQELRRDLGIDTLIVTRGKHGITRVTDGGWHHHPAAAQDVFDVSGAGDTTVAILATGCGAGLEWNTTIRFANLAAGVVIQKVGTVPITRDQFVNAFRDGRQLYQESKIYSRASLKRQVESWQARGERVVFTNGCFDILHAGHVTYLEQASQEGDRLVVGLNTDRSVQTLKGEPRPIVPEEQRARVLASLESIDAVVLFNENTPASVIEELKPDVLVKGADYNKSEVVGASAVESWGGRVELVPLVDGVSTTRILDRVRRKSD